MPREVAIPARTGLEEIQSIEHQRGVLVRVILGVGTTCQMPVAPGSTDVHEVFVFDQNQQFKQVVIAGPDYAALIAASPEWAPSKPGGEFRAEDLWRFIDAIRAR